MATNKSKGTSTARFVSLFSGCGGMDLGFIQAGFVCIGAYDVDRHCVDNYNRNVGPHAIRVDLTDPEFAAKPLPPADLIVAGAPCQGFSTIGKRNLNDPRNKLLQLAGDYVVKNRPKIFVTENVRGVKAGEHARYWNSLIARLKDNGYSTIELVADARQIGLAQLRKRVFMVALRSGRMFDVKLLDGQERNLCDVIASIDGLPNHQKRFIERDSPAAGIAKRIGPGQKLCNVRMGNGSVHTWDIPEVFGRTNANERELLEFIAYERRRVRRRQFGDADPVSIQSIVSKFGIVAQRHIATLIQKEYLRKIGVCVDLRNTFNGKFKRLSWDKPSPTVDTRFGDPGLFLHPDENRGFSVREAARIQDFPDSYKFDGPIAAQFRMIGNAVPVGMARAVANGLSEIV